MPGFPCESRDHWQVRQTMKEERERADAEIEDYQEKLRLPDGCRLLFQGVSLFNEDASRLG